MEAWALNPRSIAALTASRVSLGFGEPGSEFEQLVRQVITARGVTVQSMHRAPDGYRHVEVWGRANA